MERKSKGFIIFGSGSIAARFALGALILSALVFAWFTVSWQMGNMLAEITQPTDSNAEPVSEMAAGYAPGDPLAQWLKAMVAQDRSAKAYGGFETVIRLSPYDYRWWVQMGRAFEQADKLEQAAAAFDYANRMAPNYVLPKWQSGNFYLRQGDETKALEYFKVTATRDALYREQVFFIVWDYYDQNTEKLESIVGDDPAVLAGLARFYASKGMPRESVRAWNRLSKSEQAANAGVARLVSQAFYDKGFFASSIKFRNELGIEKGAAVGKIHNGGFEDEMLSGPEVLYSWRINRIDGMRVQTNSFKKRTGKRSLEVSFAGYDKPAIYNIFQTVAVEPGATYKVSFALKTEKLVAQGAPVVEVANPMDGRVLATSKAFPGGTNDWEIYSLEFRVPEDAEGVNIRTAREYCGEGCYLKGTFWYDDFQLEKIS
ncbi:MAG: carbohydrate binding domain-containing protein [Acidobacteriota bacterium]|nr:carbohydrate binding domain-containing protein [Acidobacteriota bacterium]MDH3529687.1 carbohydrate binding domain-containing protein [Acidobacteriota bacterium]